jgi:hypothetical protein
MNDKETHTSIETESLPMTRVVIESPFAGDVARNMEYAREAALDCLRRGEAPYASHLFFTQILDDLKPEERKLGIEAGFEWGKAAEKTVVYVDYGISRGMELGIEAANKAGRAIEYRRIKDNR